MQNTYLYLGLCALRAAESKCSVAVKISLIFFSRVQLVLKGNPNHILNNAVGFFGTVVREPDPFIAVSLFEVAPSGCVPTVDCKESGLKGKE